MMSPGPKADPKQRPFEKRTEREGIRKEAMAGEEEKVRIATLRSDGIWHMLYFDSLPKRASTDQEHHHVVWMTM